MKRTTLERVLVLVVATSAVAAYAIGEGGGGGGICYKVDTYTSWFDPSVPYGPGTTCWMNCSGDMTWCSAGHEYQNCKDIHKMMQCEKGQFVWNAQQGGYECQGSGSYQNVSSPTASADSAC